MPLLLKSKKLFFVLAVVISFLLIFELLYLPLDLAIADENTEGLLTQPIELGAQSFDFHSDNKIASINTQSKTYDYRAHIFDSYFRENNSPLIGYGQTFVDACDKYGAPHDCLLMVAIAKAETDLCKTEGADLQKNCWGFGGSGENRIVYPNYETSITEVTRRVMEGYGTRFFNDANNGKFYYCGRHCERWGDVVNSYKYEINRFGVMLGYPSLI